MNEQFTMPRKLAHELLGALFNGPGLNPAGYEALKQDFAARMRAAPTLVRREGYIATNQQELREVLDRIVAEGACERDTAMLDFLDRNLRLSMGWRVGIAPAGNLSVQSVLASKTSIRDAIAEAAARHRTTTPPTTGA